MENRQDTNGRRLRGDEGAVLVEAAFVFPVLMLLAIGIMEFGLLYMNASTVSNATASGARAGSTQSRQATYSTNAALAVAAALEAMEFGDPQMLVVYKADPNTGKPVDGDYETCGACNKYTWSGTTWTATQTGWSSSSQKACGTVANTDYLGVYVRAQHNYLTSMFGSAKTIREHTMMRLEPVPSPCM